MNHSFTQSKVVTNTDTDANFSIQLYIFIYTYLNSQTVLFLTIQFSIRHSFGYSLNVKKSSV